MERRTRKPTQRRALEKMDRIIDAAFKLFNEKGYYNTTTADIAKEANVATGSVYAYFEDKKDIYIQVIEKINTDFNQPTEDFWVKYSIHDFESPETLKKIFTSFLKLLMSYHNFSKSFHDELNALTLLDEDIAKIVKELDAERSRRTEEISNRLSIPFKSEEDSKIFLHYTDLLMEDICHKVLYDNTVKDMNLYIDRCVDMLYTLFKSTTNSAE